MVTSEPTDVLTAKHRNESHLSYCQ